MLTHVYQHEPISDAMPICLLRIHIFIFELPLRVRAYWEIDYTRRRGHFAAGYAAGELGDEGQDWWRPPADRQQRYR